MGAGVYNFELEQGADFERVFTYKTAAGVAIDVTGYGARMKIRKSTDSANALLSLGTGATGGITVGTTGGTFTVAITDTKSAALDFDNAVYDFEVVVPVTLKVIRLLKGQVTLVKEATK
jgi:hypothetical protein